MTIEPSTHVLDYLDDAELGALTDDLRAARYTLDRLAYLAVLGRERDSSAFDDRPFTSAELAAWIDLIALFTGRLSKADRRRRREAGE